MRKFNRHFSIRRRKFLMGFTLTELLIAIAIMSLLVIIAMPRFGRMVRKSREAASKGNIGALRSALSIYYSDNGGVWPWQISSHPVAGNAMNPVFNPDPTTGQFLSMTHNAIVPHYIEKMPNCYSGQGILWGNTGTGHRHEGGNWLEVGDSTRFTYVQQADHNWDCEWLYFRDTGEIWVNCKLKDINGDSISSW